MIFLSILFITQYLQVNTRQTHPDTRWGTYSQSGRHLLLLGKLLLGCLEQALLWSCRTTSASTIGSLYRALPASSSKDAHCPETYWLFKNIPHSMLAGVPATKWHSCYSQLTSSTNKPMLSTTPTLQRTHFQLIQASLHAHQLVSKFSTNAKLQRIHFQANWYGPPCYMYMYVILFPYLVPLPNYKEYTSKSTEMGPFVKCTCMTVCSHV